MEILCEDVWYEILSYLPAKDLLSCSLVSKTINGYCNNNILWKDLCKRDITDKIIKNLQKKIKFTKYKDIYRKWYILNKLKMKISSGRINFNKLSILQEVQFNGNIHEFPKEMYELKRLERLTFHYCEIPISSVRLNLFNCLKILVLVNNWSSNNKIKEIPFEIFDLHRLEILTLQNNEIRIIPPQITHLSKLKHLNLCSNLIEEIPPELGKLVKLTILDLTNNKIKDLPEELFDLVNLEYLYLGQNQINKTYPSMDKLKKLQCMNMS